MLMSPVGFRTEKDWTGVVQKKKTPNRQTKKKLKTTDPTSRQRRCPI
jgi:hypothetical protein